jgi:hypothetical protein
MVTGGGMGNVVSIDLARKSYADNGMALLAGEQIEVQIIKPSDLRLEDPPTPDRFAAALADFCATQSVSVLLLDGHQGWRYPHSQVEHMRLCERVLNTPGKTGDPGTAKPSTYLPFIQFSIDLFKNLRQHHGWNLLHEGWQHRAGVRWVVETFPSSAWMTLGLPKLPSKPKSTPELLEAGVEALRLVTGLQIPSGLTHDELQAVVCLLAGCAIAERTPDRVILAGTDPIVTTENIVLEGYIALPHLSDQQA